MTQDEELHWLALRMVPGLGTRKVGQLIQALKTPQAVFRASRSEWGGGSWASHCAGHRAGERGTVRRNHRTLVAPGEFAGSPGARRRESRCLWISQSDRVAPRARQPDRRSCAGAAVRCRRVGLGGQRGRNRSARRSECSRQRCRRGAPCWGTLACPIRQRPAGPYSRTPGLHRCRTGSRAPCRCSGVLGLTCVTSSC